jgi:hypothetical protein
LEVKVEIQKRLEVLVDVCAPVVIREGFQPITLTNSDGSIEIEITEYPTGGDYLLSNVNHTDSNGTIVSHPALKSFIATLCEVFELVTVQSSGKAYSATGDSGEIITLPDSIIREVDGSNTTVEATENHTCRWFSINLVNSEGTSVSTIPAFPNNSKHALPDVTHTDSNGESVVKPAGVSLVCTPGVQATVSPFVIYLRKPTYTTSDPTDFPGLVSSGYFDIYYPETAVKLRRLGANNFTLHVDNPNPFGNLSRYVATDGTPSIVNTAKFSTWGDGIPNIVIDTFLDCAWHIVPYGDSSTRWNNAQALVDTVNNATTALMGKRDWVRPPRNIFTASCMPDGNKDAYTSPNMIDDMGTRRYMTCEAYPDIDAGFIIYFTGGETPQSITTTAAGQNRVVIMRMMSAADYAELVA